MGRHRVAKPLVGYLRHRAEIASLLDERRFPLWWVESQISEGRIALFENDTAIIGVQRNEYPGGLIELQAMFAAGDLDGIKSLEREATEAARLAGCHVTAIESRPGWERVFRDYRKDQVRLVKELI